MRCSRDKSKVQVWPRSRERFSGSIPQRCQVTWQVFKDLGNPFDEEGTELTVLDTKVVADEERVSRMRQKEKIGMKQCDTFIKEQLIERKTPLCEPITRNKLSFFETPTKKSSKAQQQLSLMKSDCSLFSRLFITCQIRNGDLDEFFKHENQACPISITEDGHLRLPWQKFNLAPCSVCRVYQLQWEAGSLIPWPRCAQHSPSWLAPCT